MSKDIPVDVKEYIIIAGVPIFAAKVVIKDVSNFGLFLPR